MLKLNSLHYYSYDYKCTFITINLGPQLKNVLFCTLSIVSIVLLLYFKGLNVFVAFRPALSEFTQSCFVPLGPMYVYYLCVFALTLCAIATL